MAISGLALVGFVVMHLAGNLFLYDRSGMLFNQYAYKLHSLGPLLYLAEIGLLAIALLHIATGLKLALSVKKAKGVNYDSQSSKKGYSKWNVASTKMAISGTALLLFIVLHIIHFKYGPAEAEGYVVQLAPGENARDLNRYVVEQFKNIWVVAAYVIAMTMLGLHLRHGIWSAFQSLGVFKRAGSDKLRYAALGALGLLLAVGFLAIPIVIYLR